MDRQTENLHEFLRQGGHKFDSYSARIKPSDAIHTKNVAKTRRKDADQLSLDCRYREHNAVLLRNRPGTFLPIAASKSLPVQITNTGSRDFPGLQASITLPSVRDLSWHVAYSDVSGSECHRRYRRMLTGVVKKMSSVPWPAPPGTERRAFWKPFIKRLGSQFGSEENVELTSPSVHCSSP